MKQISLAVYTVAVMFLVLENGTAQKVNFSNKQQVIEPSDEKPKNADKAVKPKSFEALNGVRAASSCYNCDCQCDSYGWADSKGRFIGNCVR